MAERAAWSKVQARWPSGLPNPPDPGIIHHPKTPNSWDYICEPNTDHIHLSTKRPYCREGQPALGLNSSSAPTVWVHLSKLLNVSELPFPYLLIRVG